jgi:hypothetical protein
VTLRPGQRAALLAIMQAEAIRRRQWWAPRKEQLDQVEKPTERSILRARFKREYAAAVESGRLISTRDTLIVPAVVAELDERGWRGPYDPLPVSARGPGRRWGSTNVGGDRRHLISVRLPADLHGRLERACYWETLDLVNQLEAFYDNYGDSPNLPEARPGEEPDALAIRYRDQLRADIVTTGDILRAAIDRVIKERPPESAADESESAGEAASGEQ